MEITVCTAVAKNYLAMAKTLGDSIKNNWPGVKFIIILADETDGCISCTHEPYEIIEAKDIGIPDFMQMAFKYNVIEFSTAIKPFAFEYLINIYQPDLLFYLDPDMYVYRPLDEAIEALKTKSVALTPHMLDSSVHNEFFERNSLGAGIFNLGFYAMRNCENSFRILKWWQKKLSDFCYLSNHENLFYDQKWMNFLPVYFDDIFIIKSKSYNIARWNFAERRISIKNEIPYVKDTDGKIKPAALIHFSGYKPGMNSFGAGKISIDKFQEKVLWKIFKTYGEQVANNNANYYLKLQYKYDYYENGDLILPIHRRIYRVLKNEQKEKISPFSCATGSFYELMKKNRMLINNESSADFRISTSGKMQGFHLKLAIMDKFMRFMKQIIGIKNYLNLLKYCNNYCFEERQVFLVKKKG